MGVRYTNRASAPAAAAAVALGLLAAGCSAPAARPAAQVKRVVMPAARLTITPADRARHTRPDRGVTVTVANGTLGSVAVSTHRHPVAGRRTAGRTACHSPQALRP